MFFGGASVQPIEQGRATKSGNTPSALGDFFAISDDELRAYMVYYMIIHVSCCKKTAFPSGTRPHPFESLAAQIRAS